MPSHRRELTRASAADIAGAAFAAGSEQLFGIELEWPVHRSDDVSARPSESELRAVSCAPLPHRSRLTTEPGGQVELSTLPASSVDDALTAASEDAVVLHDRMRRAGLLTAELAVDTRRAPGRILDAPRYACMESFFAKSSDAGTWMMCNTSSLQVNVSHDAVDPQRRWALAQRLGPVFVAMFANAPGLDSSGRRWESMRQAIWWSIDHGRTRPLRCDIPGPEAWLDYALAADVMLVRSTDATDARPIPPDLPFARWLSDGHELGWPTADDFRYHLTTLFPPIRPRGWLELRMIDLLPASLCDVATVVVAASLTTEAGLEIAARLPETRDLWCAAARYGMARPDIAAACRIVMDIVLSHVNEVTADPRRRDAVRAYADRYVARGVSPAHLMPSELLDATFAPTLALGSQNEAVLAVH